MGALIAYYSRADENYVGGALRTLKVGNTAVAATLLQAITGADLFQIEQVQPYARDYNTCIDQARADQRRGARPDLKAWPEGGLAGYDTIYLGYPNYWGTMPMAVWTFLEAYDLAGKTILPFCTHEGSGLGSSVADLRRLCPDALVGQGLAIVGGSAARSKPELENWIRRMQK